MPSRTPHVYYVYVIESSDRAGRRILYVGQSGKTPAARLRDHTASCKRYCSSCRCRHYVALERGAKAPRLRWDLFAGYNPMESRGEAEAAERSLARKLKARGYTVRGGH